MFGERLVCLCDGKYQEVDGVGRRLYSVAYYETLTCRFPLHHVDVKVDLMEWNNLIKCIKWLNRPSLSDLLSFP